MRCITFVAAFVYKGRSGDCSGHSTLALDNSQADGDLPAHAYSNAATLLSATKRDYVCMRRSGTICHILEHVSSARVRYRVEKIGGAKSNQSRQV
jgi:hypothetical protein